MLCAHNCHFAVHPSTLWASGTLVGAVIGAPTSMLDAQPRATWKGRCACVFVDIGLNDGSTLLTWWKRIDLERLPTEQAQRLRVCRAKPLESHCFFGFEASSRWSTQLKALQERLQRRGARVELFTDTALSTEDGERIFYVERDSKSPNYAATLEANLVQSYRDGRGRWHRNTAFNDDRTFHNVTVKTRDAGPFFQQLVALSDIIAVKMDIEGSEYHVLRHLLLTQPRALCRLSVLVVEWHEQIMTASEGLPRNLSSAFQWLLSKQQACNVGFITWH